MGAFLDHPKTEKENFSGEGRNANLQFKYGLSYMQGWRIDMEDAHCVNVEVPDFKDWSFFAVFDGHAGSKVAIYSAANVLSTVLATEEFQKLKQRSDMSLPLNEEEQKLVKTGFETGFLTLDSVMQNNHDGDDRERSGTTAVMALLTPHHVIFANLGDSRGLLCRKSEIFGTEDHKPYLDKERERIVKAGGSVMIQRVNGSLAVSRAFGDFEYKSVPSLSQREQLVSPEPDVSILHRNKDEDEFMVLACDGIYDVLENDELCNIIRSRLTVTDDITVATNQILDVCLSKGSRDNMTLILVVFEAAPKMILAEAEKEKVWENITANKIQDFLDSMEGKATEAIDADIISRYLAENGDDNSKPGGIHLARTLIQHALDHRMPQALPSQGDIPMEKSS